MSVRRARADNIDEFVLLGVVLPEHLAQSPVFSAGPLSNSAEARREWTELLDDDNFALFVAERDALFLGAAVGCPVEKSGLHAGVARPDAAAFLGFAAVLPRARGLGAGRALGEAVLAWAAAEGFCSVVTDWRATNLLSARTWPRLGFHETFLRLHRMIGY